MIAPALVTGVEAVTTGAVESFVRGRKMHLVEQLQHDARTMAAQLYRAPRCTCRGGTTFRVPLHDAVMPVSHGAPRFA